MSFGAPHFLIALVSLPALMAFLWWVSTRRTRAVSRIGDPVLVERLGLAANSRMRLLRFVLWFLAVTLVIVAVARPQWGSDIEIVERGGVRLMIALDVSGSMLVQDLKPTRLDRAKLEISDLISRLDGDAVGIVLFSGASFIQFPLTIDYATARTYLGHASPSAISRQGTVIAEAIDIAMTGFSDERPGQKIIVIMTDGENHEGDPISAARRASDEGAVIYTVGFGSPEGGPVPEHDEFGNVTGFRQGEEGRTLVSRPDEIALQQIAESGGGAYFRASEPAAMADLAAEIQSHQDATTQSEFSQRRVERFQIFLLIGAFFLALTEVLTDRLFRPTRTRPREPAGEPDIA